MTQQGATPATAGRLSLWQAAFVVARRDFLAILLSKAFVFFLIGPLFFVGISMAAGALGSRAAESVTPPGLAVALDSPAERMALARAHKRLDPLVSLPPVTTIEDGRTPDALLADRSANYAGVLTGTLARPRLTGTEANIEAWKGEVALLAAEAAGADGLSASATNGAVPEVLLAPRESSVAAERRGNKATATAGITLLFLLSMLLAGMVLSNLVEEKGNKIIEILAASIPMDAVFLGKLFAMLAVSFVGISVWGALALVFVGAGAGEMPFVSSPAIGWPAFVLLFLVYFALAYLLVGSVFLTVGAMAPTVRDVQTLSMPATILQLLVFFIASFAVSDVGGAVETLALIFPLSSPYAMLSRAAQFDTLWWHALGIAWQLVWVGIFVRAGSTLFRRKVMQSGPARGGKGWLRRRLS